MTRIPWQDLLLGNVDAICLGETELCVESHTSNLIFPGAFDPLHQGHLRMAQIAAELVGQVVEFEVSVENVDKAKLNDANIEARTDQFSNEQPIWLTRAATFVEKSRIFPGATFIVGADTIVRIADPGYYGNEHKQRDAAIDEIIQRGCRFLVFGRLWDDEFRELPNLKLPQMLVEICDQVAADVFRQDITSTELRSRRLLLDQSDDGPKM